MRAYPQSPLKRQNTQVGGAAVDDGTTDEPMLNRSFQSARSLGAPKPSAEGAVAERQLYVSEGRGEDPVLQRPA